MSNSQSDSDFVKSMKSFWSNHKRKIGVLVVLLLVGVVALSMIPSDDLEPTPEPDPDPEPEPEPEPDPEVGTLRISAVEDQSGYSVNNPQISVNDRSISVGESVELESGSYTVSVSADMYASKEITVDVNPNEVTEKTVVLERTQYEYPTAPDCSEHTFSGDGTESSPYEISNVYDLQCINQDVTANYMLTQDINAYSTTQWNDGSGFTPIGELNSGFSGTLNGQGYEVQRLLIDRPEEDFVGLFGTVNGGNINNVGLVDTTVNGELYVGGLVGRSDGSSNVSSSYVVGDVSGYSQVGGLVGELTGDSEIVKSHSSSEVSGEYRAIGGLVGNNGGTISNSYATGSVSSAELENSQSGLVGGLVGVNDENGSISNSYAANTVSSSWRVGGIVGNNLGSVSGSYWDVEVTNQDDPAGNNNGTIDVTGLTTSEMQGSSASDNMSAFDFDTVWMTVEDDYPQLQ